MAETPPVKRSTLLAGHSVIVTGGTRGIGWEIALALISAGANVVVTGRSQSDLDKSRQRAASVANGGQLHAIAADVRLMDDCMRVAAATVDRFGGITGLINNAGVAMRLASEQFETDPLPFWQVGAEAWRAIVDTNVSGVFYMSRCAVPAMLNRGKGRLINVSSSPRMMRLAGWSPYGASKAAIESMSATWAQELSATGVTVNVVRPGGKVDTGLFPNGGHGALARDGFLAPGVMNGLVIWLLSDASDGVSGRRFNASLWDDSKNEDDAAHAAMLPYPEEPHLY
jgi:NAD(P)-dependent dehydrogenase (short-subunit alcohol dehydrogenase family)